MSSPVLSWIAVGVLGFVGNATLRPAVARAATDEEPTVTPYNMPARPAPPPAAPPAANPPPPPARPPAAPPPAAATTVQPIQPAPAPQPYPGYPPPGYPPPGYPPGYAPPGYPPAGYGPYPGYPPLRLTKVHRPRRGLVTGGAVTFGVSWGIAATVSLLVNDSCTGCTNNAEYLWVPIAGPIIVAARESSDAPQIFILWSLAEAAGVVMFIVGMVGHDVMEYQVAHNGPRLRLTPMIARNAGGMGLTAHW